MNRWSPVEQKHIPTEVLWNLLTEVASFEGMPPADRSFAALKKSIGFSILGAVVLENVTGTQDEEDQEGRGSPKDYVFLIRTSNSDMELFYACCVWWAPFGDATVTPSTVTLFSEYSETIGGLLGALERSVSSAEPQDVVYGFITLLDAHFSKDEVSEILLEYT